MPLYYYHPYVSGVSVCAKRVAEGLVKRGYSVTVVTSRHEKDLPKEEVINGVRVIRRPVLLKLGKGVIMPTFWFDIIRFARKNDYVNPHLPMADSGISALFIPKHKTVTTYQCDINLGGGVLDKVIAKVSMALMHLQLIRSKIIVPSTLDYLSKSKMSRYGRKAHEINPTVTVNEFTHTDPKPLLKKLGIDTSRPIVGFMGRIVYEKGLQYLLESIPYIQKEIGPFRLLIAGDYSKVAGGSVKDELDTYIKAYGDTVMFTGYLSDEDRNRFYSALDVFVLPSIDPLEAFGMVQIEAMLCGAPVVASDLPGVQQIVLQTGYGKIAKRKDPKDIARQVVAVLKNPTQYRPDRKKVAARFDPDKTIDAYEACFAAQSESV
jgi:glycosyltransferase involved in cell wall biosynthesis